MNSAVLDLSTPFAPASAAPNIVIFYGDMLLAELASEVVDDFSAAKGPDVPTIAKWNLDLLDEPGFCDHIREQVSRADMIVVSIDQRDGLSRALKRWIREWAMEEIIPNRAVVIVLRQSKGAKSEGVRRFARRTASQARLEFFRQRAGHHIAEHRPQCHEAFWLL